MAKKDPAFLFYSDDFYIGTSHFTNEQVGIYIRLLIFQHQKGWIEEDDFFSFFGSTKLAPNSHQTCTDFAPIRKKFTRKNTGKKIYYYNKRLQYEITKRAEYAESRRKNARSTKSKTNNPIIQNSSYSNNLKKAAYAIHMGNGNGNRKEGFQREKNTYSKDQITQLAKTINVTNSQTIYWFMATYGTAFNDDQDLIKSFKKYIKPHKFETKKTKPDSIINSS